MKTENLTQANDYCKEREIKFMKKFCFLTFYIINIEDYLKKINKGFSGKGKRK